MTQQREQQINDDKYILLVVMFISFILSTLFVQVAQDIIMINGASEYSGLIDSGIDLSIIENDAFALNGAISLAIFLVPLSLFAGWCCYFFKQYRIGLLFASIPSLLTVFLIYLAFPAGEFSEVLLYMFSIDGLIKGLMAATLYWLLPVSLMALVVRFFAGSSPKSESR